jgi:hypothetical protein
MTEINKDKIMTAILKEYPSTEDRQLIAQYLQIIGGCPHLNKWHNPGFRDSLMKCLDCGAENI